MLKSDIKKCIEARQGFKSKNCAGYYLKGDYIIKSYNTVIYSDITGLDLKKYSHTTSKLQKIISLAFYDIDFLKCDRVKAIDGQDFIKV